MNVITTKPVQAINFNPNDIPKEIKNEILDVTPIVCMPLNDCIPIILKWRFKIENDGDVLFSSLFEGHYKLYFEFTENPLIDIRAFVKSSHFQLTSAWDKVTDGTPLENRHIGNVTPAHIFKVQQEIIDKAKDSNFLISFDRN